MPYLCRTDVNCIDLGFELCSVVAQDEALMKVLEHKNKSSSRVYRSGGTVLRSLSARCLLFIFSAAFLCRCGEQPTSAGFFFFQATQFETKAKYTGPFIRPRHGEERESRKRGRDSKMTVSLFFLTLISLEDK